MKNLPLTAWGLTATKDLRQANQNTRPTATTLIRK